MNREQLLGGWRLEVCDVLEDGRVILRPFGETPVGLLTYTADGTMAVAIMRSGRAPFNVNDILAASEAEKASSVDGYLSYAGSFELHGDRIRHRVEVSLFPNWTDTSQERIARIEEDRLILSTDPVALGGRVRVARMAWRRIASRG